MPQCCLTDCAEYAACRADLNRSGEVDLPDLALLLAAYDPNYDPDADLNADGDVNLADLALLLAAYGNTCTCFGGGGAPESGGGGAAALSWVAANTLGTAAGNFVFDLNVQLSSTSDVWTASGVALTAQNGAEFVLASTPTTQNAAATFVCAPGAMTAESAASVEIAGSFLPPDATEVFDADEINIVWYDPSVSTSSSGSEMRLVIDASSVTDGGSPVAVSNVYFSATGPARQGDVLIVNVAASAGTVLGGADAAAISGAFYATE